MTASEAIAELDRLALGSGGIKETRDSSVTQQAPEPYVIQTIVRGKYRCPRIVVRDVRILVYLDEAKHVTRVEKRDVFTGP